MDRRALFRQLLSVCDLLTLMASFVSACLIYGRFLHHPPHLLWPLMNYIWILWVIGPVWLLSLRSLQFYKPEFHDSFLGILGRLVRAHLLAGLMLLSTMYLTKSAIVSRLVLQIFLALSFIALFVEKCAVKVVLDRISRSTALSKRKALVVCDISQIGVFSDMVDKHAYWLTEIAGFLVPATQAAQNGNSGSSGRILGKPADLPEVLRSHIVDEVVVISPFDKAETELIARWCTSRGIAFKVFLDLPRSEFGSYGAENLGSGAYVLSFHTTPQHAFYLLAKRLLDIVGSLLGLAACGLVYVWYAPRLRRESPGPVFFRQERGGQNGRTFTIYKFRTMYPDAEQRLEDVLPHNEMQGTIFKMKNDPRVTPTGRMMRERHLDELPQFWNVLKGEMSLVGARPCPSYEVATYEFHHHRRLSMKPGITGPWQLYGNGAVANFDDIVRLDCEYIDNWSLWRDIEIIARTVTKMARGGGW